MLTWDQSSYQISTDPDRFDVDAFHEYLTADSYWAKGRRRDTTEAALDNSLVFGAYAPGGEMVGAARVVTDCATFGWLCDFYVLESHRGQGLGKALVQAVRSHPCLIDTKRLLLATDDAHELYEKFGFSPLRAPEKWMEYNGSTI
ncbi:MAG: GNAT family N-acetyltransferase [Acidimicrobiia bacterium]